jgi:hypothetical protein
MRNRQVILSQYARRKMAKKTHKILETPSGLGEIRKNGEHLANVLYSLEVKQEIIESKSFTETQELEGMKSISGEISIDLNERMKPVVLSNMDSGEPFILYLSDNRQIELLVVQSDIFNGKYRVKPYGSQGLVPR